MRYYARCIGNIVTDPLSGAKAPLGETQKNVRNDGPIITDSVAAKDSHSDSASGRATNGLPVQAPSESDVSSGKKEKRSRKRWNKRSRSRSKQTSSDKQTSPALEKAEEVASAVVDVATHLTPSDKPKRTRRRNTKNQPKSTGSENGTSQANHSAPIKRQHSANTYQNQPLYAALDLGTNNCRLLVAKPMKSGQFRVVDAFSRIVRLGEGLAATGKLSDEAMDRAVGALKICASKLGRHRIRNYRLIATEACRQASNGATFLERVKRETGLNLEIINRETEARLAVSGCASLVDRETQSVILFDIGGGSSEIAAIQFSEKRTQKLANHIQSWTSLPVGVVTLSERHGGQNVTPAVFDAMVKEVDDLIATTAPPAMLEFAPNIDTFHLLGTSGTVTTLAGLHLELPRYDRRRVDGLWLQDADVDRILTQLLSWDLEARSANPCIGPDRSDLVLAGCAIMQSIRKRWPSNRMRVADRGLREGLLNDMMAKDGVWRRRRRRRHTPSGNHQNGNQNGNSHSDNTAARSQLDDPLSMQKNLNTSGENNE